MTREEQVLSFLETVEGTFKEKRKIAKKMGVALTPPEIREQLGDAALKLGHVPAKAEEGTSGRDYAVVPALYLNDQTVTRETWVRLEVAREVGQALIRLADEAENQ